jgi:hypothetical protein
MVCLGAAPTATATVHRTVWILIRWIPAYTCLAWHPDLVQPGVRQQAGCDGDGETNGYEYVPGTDYEDPCDYTQTPAIGSSVWATWSLLDCDGDGASNGDEIDPDGNGSAGPNGTDPLNPCSLNISDGSLEATKYPGDCDGDGVSNANENQQKINEPQQTLRTRASTMHRNRPRTRPRWSQLDCDGDGVTNGDEVDPDGDGIAGPNGTDPRNPRSLTLSDVSIPATSTGDCDGDGVTNADEINSNGPGDPRTYPNNPCSLNIAEQSGSTGSGWSSDRDGDGTPNGSDTQPLNPCVPGTDT